MPRNGSGTYTLPESPFVPSTVISSAAVNDDFSDIAAALTGSVAADGQTPLTGNLQAANGSSSAPGWTFRNDNTAGVYLNAVGSVGIGAGGFDVLVNSTALTIATLSPSNAGSGYKVSDTFVIAGGTGVLACIGQVLTLSGSGIATASVVAGGNYSVLPSPPASVASTSGAGTGATFTFTSGAALQVSDESGLALWTELGATSYMAAAMAQPGGLQLATYIGAANLAAAIETSLPVPTPQGYLTPVSNTPIIVSDSIAATALYYTPLIGLWNPIHNGTTIVPYALSGQLQLTLTSAQAADNLYDIFLAYNAGSPVIGTGPSWTAGSGGNITAGSCARGTGAGGTSLARLQGAWTNAASMTLTWNTGAGNNSLTVAANQGIYLGTIYVDHTQGQVTNHIAWGQNRKRGLANGYNAHPVTLQAGDSTASWTYTSSTVRASNATPASWSSLEYNVGSGTACNGLTVLCGLAEEPLSLQFMQETETAASSVFQGEIGIGLNSTTAFSGSHPLFGGNNSSTVASGRLDQAPLLGINTFQALEKIEAASPNNVTYRGTQANMTLTAQWRA